MGRIDDLANRYVADWAELSPTGATYVGIAGHDDRLDDLSPEGYAARAELARRALADLDATEPDTEAERTAREAMQERLGLELDRYAAGETTSEVSVITSGLHEIRMVFDLMPTEGDEARANIASRLNLFSGALEAYKTTLREATAAGRVSSRAQLLEVAKQCDSWVDPEGDNIFHGLVERLGADGTLGADLRRGAAAATAATAEFGQFLRTELAPHGREKQAAGRERYELASQYFLGARVDLDETYAWGFTELARLEADMRTVAAQICGPGATIDDAVAALDADPARTIQGKDAFRDWMQELADQAISDLNGTHFDIPEHVRRIECMIAPTSDGSIYYTGPSEDFARPGRMWWAVPQGVTDFSTWREVTTVYHEGVPGHHLQVGQTAVRAELLNRWQRLLCWVSGHGEGWALYAERLMDELGYLEDPGDKFGMLDGQAFRAARVIVDIGMHLELAIPADNPFDFHPGERWTPELGWEFLRAHCRVPDEMLRFELNRYLGWPGQAPSYKVGERIWLQARDDAKVRKGADFDLREFHRQALDLGALGLDPLRRALARL
ncbi:Uncharacterized conserved protein, DUF885 familyt [Micromonospora phaseoli]|uniref:Uncharacterized conserved protein, DUF885 familyt n=1 Tax=Micromonospora phaseoli TaxID=1144548 RepID=A0A1H7DEM2_9ACTN|nr:DUF885 domain-containing protein [Micromonospora phaseoli]PZV90476.1 uncharacterized protein (DUF885 family) [Micromonospora phaseoli]GIJ78132.1 hypothetical protein Xph01_25640 [Micromonospora phaseoli]SEK00261.1 Uncharacterized conserved protein, DUF885 familyt [Micromonospora phaseoli]